MFHKKVLQVGHTLQIKAEDKVFKYNRDQSGIDQPAYQNGVGEREREGERDWGE